MSSSATIENVTDYSTLTSSSGSIGGIAGRVTGGTITMKNVVMKGSYYNGFGYTLLKKNYRGSYEPIKVLR